MLSAQKVRDLCHLGGRLDELDGKFKPTNVFVAIVRFQTRLNAPDKKAALAFQSARAGTPI
jgi:hypothetical protein